MAIATHALREWLSKNKEAAPFSPNTTDWALHRERVLTLYSQTPYQALASIMAAAALSLFFPIANAFIVLMWMLGIIATQTVRMAFWGAQRRQLLRISHHSWEHIYLGLTLVNATIIGCCGAYFLTTTSAMGQILALFFMFLPGGVSLTLAPASFRAAMLSIGPIAGIPLILLSFSSTDLAPWIQALLGVVLAVLGWVTWQLERRTTGLSEAARHCAELETSLATQSYLAQRTRETLQNVLDCVKTGVAVYDADLRLMAWNENYTDIHAEATNLVQEGSSLEITLRHLSHGSSTIKAENDRTIADYLRHLTDGAQRDEVKMEFTLEDGRIIEINSRQTADRGWVLTLTDLTSGRKAATEAMLHVSRHDSLTGLPNLASIRRGLERTVSTANRTKGLVTVMMLNIGGFREISGRLGAATSDDILVEVSRRLLDNCRKEDIVGRLGGGEFAIISNGLNTITDVEQQARRLEELLCLPMDINHKNITISLDIGITVYPFDNGSPEELLRNAGIALARARQLDQNNVVMFDGDMQREMQARTAMEADIRANIGSHYFMFHYQPQIDLKTKQLVGVEALLRWHHPDRGWVSPDKFIPIAELSRLIIPLTERMMPEVCLQAKAWDVRGLPPFKIAVNLSPVHIRSGAFPSFFEELLKTYNLKPDRFEFEITESVMMTDSTEAIETLRHLERLGSSLAIDDFGTGYASISYLRRFPVNKLKIDRSFINEVTHDAGARAIVEAVTRLGHSFGLTVVAEGVETEDQATALQIMGCDTAQGYLFSRPLLGDDFSIWAENRFTPPPSIPLLRPLRQGTGGKRS